MHRPIVSCALVVLSAGWLIAQPAAAQNQSTSPSVPDASTPNANVSDQKLDQAAAAIKNVQVVRNTYDQKVSAASPQEQTKIVTEANTAMQKAVTDQGLSVDEYNSIVQLAQNDPSVRERIVKRLGAIEK
jgi:hypothetical protein